MCVGVNVCVLTLVWVHICVYSLRARSKLSAKLEFIPHPRY